LAKGRLHLLEEVVELDESSWYVNLLLTESQA
jgi:hypothetical protein